MQLDNLLGNTETKQALCTALSTGRLPHAVLFAAPDGCGRGFAARCLAADYLFPAGGPAAAAVMAAQSPEFLVVEGEGRSGNIPVARIREVKSDMFLSALSAHGRVVWIKNAHQMGIAAANALLKVLEEPPAEVLFILTAADSSRIPVTVRSRCALYPLAPVSLVDCERTLGQQMPPGTDPSLPALLAAVYGGRIGSGLNALADPARLTILQNAMGAAKAVAAGGKYELLRIFSGYEGRGDDGRLAREALLADLADIFTACLHGAAAEALPAVPPGAAARSLPPVLDAAEALRQNGAPKLVLTSLAVKLMNPALS